MCRWVLLAGVIAPVVIVGTDADLVDSGLADADWVALHAALGDVGMTEGRMADLERQAGAVANVTGHLIKRAVGELSAPKQPAVVAVLGTAAGALVWRHRKRPRRTAPRGHRQVPTAQAVPGAGQLLAVAPAG